VALGGVRRKKALPTARCLSPYEQVCALKFAFPKSRIKVEIIMAAGKEEQSLWQRQKGKNAR
jgi:hypothetical protein